MLRSLVDSGLIRRPAFNNKQARIKKPIITIIIIIIIIIATTVIITTTNTYYVNNVIKKTSGDSERLQILSRKSNSNISK